MALSFSDYSGGNPAPAQAAAGPVKQAGGRKSRGKRTAKKCSKKLFVWKGGEGSEVPPEEPSEKPPSEGGKRRRKSARKSARKSKKSKKFFGLF